jgi:hypothetical protein
VILRQYRSLGLLPEIITFVFLGVAVVAAGGVLWRISWRDPVMLVPNARGSGPLRPAAPDDAYLREFCTSFLMNWTSWNQHSYQFRKTQAISLMTPAVRAQFTEMARRSGELVASLAESQTYHLTSLEIAPADVGAGLWQARFTGEMLTYYGGVGGHPDPYRGILLLHALHPTAENPLCLEVLGFKTDKPPALEPR